MKTVPKKVTERKRGPRLRMKFNADALGTHCLTTESHGQNASIVEKVGRAFRVSPEMGIVESTGFYGAGNKQPNSFAPGFYGH